MIDRYSQKDIAAIWEDRSRFNYYLKIELANLSALKKLKIVSPTIKNAKIDLKKIKELENIYHHELIAFCYAISPKIDNRLFHYGLTSSDVIDSATNMMVKDSLVIILKELQILLKSLKKLALKYKNVSIMGRTHGMFAEPLPLKHKLDGHYQELLRRFNDLNKFKDELTVQFSGAVGNYSITDKRVEKLAAKLLKMPSEPISTQIIPRDRLAKLVSINALLSAAIERMATNFRLLHQSEINEIILPKKEGQQGSSTMPHKTNPIGFETLCGIGRIVRNHLNIAIENIITWQERDLTQSSSERLYLPDNLNLICFMIRTLSKLLSQIQFNTTKMQKRIDNDFATLSNYYLHKLIQKTNWNRIDCYTLIQKTLSKSSSLKDFINNLEKETGLKLFT